MKHKYTIVKDNKDPKSAVIKKTNIEIEFTVNQLNQDVHSHKKMVRELKANADLADAKMKNIEDHHPFVMDLSEEQCFTVHMYQEARAMSRVCKQKLPEFEKELERIEKEKKDIEKQTGLSFDEPVAEVTTATHEQKR